MSEYERLTSYMQVGNKVVQIVPQRKQRIQAYIDRLFDLEDKIEGGELISKEQFEQLQAENAELRARLDKAVEIPDYVFECINGKVERIFTEYLTVGELKNLEANGYSLTKEAAEARLAELKGEKKNG